MNDRTAVLFLILCIAVLLGLIELEKIWEQEKINQKEQSTEKRETPYLSIIPKT